MRTGPADRGISDAAAKAPSAQWRRPAVPDLPSGTVTLLFTDVQGSTRLLQQLGDRYADVLAEHRRLLREAADRAGGREVDTQGEAFLFVFPRARDAVAAAVRGQQALLEYAWPAGAAVHVRMGLHTGEPRRTGEGYVGLDVHRAARIAAAGHGGQILLSQTTRDLVDADLPAGAGVRDLGEHRLKDLERPERIFQLVHQGLPSDFPRLKTLDTLPNNLPRLPSLFIGREQELAAVQQFLAATPLLTLTGTGGAGKTRLAIQAAAVLLPQFSDGVWLVELAPVSDPALVPQAVASALGVQEGPGRGLLAAVVEYLRPRELLLIFDNCEHLLGASAQLADTILRSSPRVRILATSREGLGVAGEMTYRVPSLSLPEPERIPPADEMQRYEAIRLFVERARYGQPAFGLTAQNAAAVLQICQRLDGIPLAIELAAARIRAFSPDQLARRLDDRFHLLAGASRTALPRHQTLRATMDWSWDLLADPERALLRRLAVFNGGFMLEAAEAVCAGDGIEAGDVPGLLSRLVDKSLVVADEHGGDLRYRLLDTVRQYTRDRLLETAEADRIRSNHVAFFLALAEDAEPRLGGSAQVEWFARLGEEHDNLRAALEWAAASRDTEAALRIASALWWFWYVRGYFTEGLRWFEAALAADAPAALRCRALSRAAVLAWRLGDIGRGAALAQEAYALCTGVADKRGMALSLISLAAVHLGDPEAGEPLCAESLALFREAGDRWGMGLALVIWGVLTLNRGDYAGATRLFEERLALARTLGDRRSAGNTAYWLGRASLAVSDDASASALAEDGLAHARDFKDTGTESALLSILGRVALHARDFARARARSEESLALSQQIGERFATPLPLTTLGILAALDGDYDRACALLCESLVARRNLGDRAGMPESLEALASVALADGQGTRAAILLGAGQALRQSTGVGRPAAEQEAYDSAAGRARAALGEPAWNEAYEVGRRMSVGEVLAYALREATDTGT